ncbi:SusC/RagA family TonB-linked outer membrane protein [Parapedobacter koreensis]|nr:TonB-dependent receptor [Parapedobacter koreensis]
MKRTFSPLQCSRLGVATAWVMASAIFPVSYARPASAPEIAVRPVTTAPAQQTIAGRVIDASGTPLPSATVSIKNTSTQVRTDGDGRFSITAASPNAVLVVNYIGYEPLEVPASATFMTITLSERQTALDEVVVVGYGTQKRSDLTGAIATIDASEVNRGINQTVSHALQGQAPGVTVVQNSGEPGAGVEIRIRGAGSINDNSPLYVVDGIIGSIGNLNPADVESISVLKDAASAAIYGARGANGVVIVTTKKGTRNQKTTISLNTNQGIQQVWKKPESLSAEQMVLIHTEALTNDGTPASESIWDYYNNPQNSVTRTNWFDEVFRTAYNSTQDLSFAGGTDRSNFLFSLGNTNNNGVVNGTYYKRFNVRINSQHELFKNFSVGENIMLAVTTSKVAEFRGAYDGVLSSAYFNMRNIPVWQDEANEIYGAPSGDFPNPVASLDSRDNRNRGTDIRGNFYGEYKLLDFITLKSDFAYSFGQSKNKSFVAIAQNGGRGLNQNSLSEYFSNNDTWIWNNTVSWDKQLGGHHLSGIAGMSLERGKNEWTSSGTAQQFSIQDPNLRYFDNAGSFPNNVGGSADDYSLMSYFGRLSYAYGDRYLFTANIRRDGSSKFGPNNRWGTFPSVSAGWRLSNETFFESLRPIINEFKIRGSWGQLGNDKISNYQYYSTISSVGSPTLNGNIFTAVAQNRLSNQSIKWEVTSQTDVGVDIGLLDNRLSLAFDYYDKLTEDILVRVPLLASYGVSTAPFVNAGEVSNKGFEVSASYSSANNKDFTYRITGNVGHVKNELVSMGVSGSNALFLSNYKNTNVGRMAEGEPLGHFYVLHALGLFQSEAEVAAYTNAAGNPIQPNAQPGDIKFEDINGDGVISADDRTIAGDSFPSLTYSANFAASYKGFDFDMMWIGSSGNEIFNGLTLGGKLMQGTSYNNGTDILNRWTPSNTGTDVPRVSVRDLNNNRAYSTFFIEDGSFLRMKYASLGYTFQNGRFLGDRISRLRLFFTAQNLITITDYSGFDPEVGADSGTSGNMYGVDRGTYPQAKSFIFGVNLNF